MKEVVSLRSRKFLKETKEKKELDVEKKKKDITKLHGNVKEINENEPRNGRNI